MAGLSFSRNLSTIVPVEVCQADWCDEKREGPTHSHREAFHPKQKDGIHEEHVLTHHVAHNALVYESRVWIKQRANDRHEDQPRLTHEASRAMSSDRQNQDGEQRPENKLTDVIARRKPTKCFRQK